MAKKKPVKPLKIPDPYHKLNHHRKAGPMKDKPRRLTEAEEIEEHLEVASMAWEDGEDR